MVNSWPGLSRTGPAANVPSRIFGPCRSTSTPTLCPDGVGRRPDLPVDGQVPVLAAVAHVQPGHVHPRGDQAGHLVRGAGRGPKRADDFRPAAAGHVARLVPAAHVVATCLLATLVYTTVASGGPAAEACQAQFTQQSSDVRTRNLADIERRQRRRAGGRPGDRAAAVGAAAA